MSYAQISDMMKRYDTRVLGDLVNDTGTRQTVGLATDLNLQAALDDAAGMIDAAVYVNERYANTDLTNLVGQDQAFLFRVNCDLAYGLLLQRRGMTNPLPPAYLLALDWLQRLRNGERVFSVQANESRGNPTSEFVSFSNLAQINLARDAACRYFPGRRFQQMPSIGL